MMLMQDTIVQNVTSEEVVILEDVLSSEEKESAETTVESSEVSYQQLKTWALHKTKLDSVSRAREDSIIRSVNDSLAHQKSGYGIVLHDPYYVATQKELSHNQMSDAQGGVSWLYALMAFLFCLICFKSKGNPKYFRHLFSNLNEVRIRHNMFDSTVRESSYMLILNVVWVVSAGIILWSLSQILDGVTSGSPDLPLLAGVGICIGVTFAYKLLMLLGYEIAGNVFTDSRTTKEWVKGANSESALESVPLFAIALLTLIYPEWNLSLVWVSAVVIGVGKILFIFKGFRIFVNQFSSFLLFLYYLCILEIIPIILAIYSAGMLLSSIPQ